MDALKLAKNLVSIPSYVDPETDESEVGEFLEELVSKEFPELKTSRQKVEKNRFNLICKGSDDPKLLVIGHIDTVQPTSGWSSDPLLPEIKDDRLFGLGSCDMKGSIAAFLAALKNVQESIDLKDLVLLFYIDEEYDFKGMRKFVAENPKINPDIAFTLDGGLELESGCRGLIELDLEFKGESGHSANPYNGNNVITGVASVVDGLSRLLSKYKDKFMGPTTVNLAYLRGGRVLSEDKDGRKWGREGNVIPDFADATIEIRVADDFVDAEFVKKALESLCYSVGLRVAVKRIRHDLGMWPVSYECDQMGEIIKSYEKAGVPFSKGDRNFSGYNDAAMLCDVIESPVFKLGAGGENPHGAGENVPIQNLAKCQKIWENLLVEFCAR